MGAKIIWPPDAAGGKRTRGDRIQGSLRLTMRLHGPNHVVPACGQAGQPASPCERCQSTAATEPPRTHQTGYLNVPPSLAPRLPVMLTER